MSNSLIVDLDNDEADIENLKKDLLEASDPDAENDEDVAEEGEDELPEKYRGKSLEDVIKMHQNAESELGRKGNELGQYMSLTDQLLQLKRAEDLQKGGASSIASDDPDIEISTDELLDNPKAALDKLVNARIEQYNRNREQQDAQRTMQERMTAFQKRHPDAQEITSRAEFREWVEGSPSRQLAASHAAQGDLDIGDALLSEWKALQEQELAEKGKRKAMAEAKKAGTERRGSSKVSDAPTGKTYKRLDLIRLKLQDPEAYGDPSFQEEIMRAYAEGRVK